MNTLWSVMPDRQINIHKRDKYPHPVEKASTPRLVLMLMPAFVSILIAKIPQRARERMVTFFGVISMVSPLALWIAATPRLLAWVLGIALFSIVMCWLLVTFGPDDEY